MKSKNKASKKKSAKKQLEAESNLVAGTVRIIRKAANNTASATDNSAESSLSPGSVRIVRKAANKTPPTERDLIANSALFDAEWYFATNEDVAESGADPAQHYLLLGGLEGRPASLAFHSASYLAHNTDVAKADVNPLLHYIQYGESENRHFEATPAFIEAFGEDYSDFTPYMIATFAKSELFDSVWFSEAYPAVKKSGLNPIVYFILHGFSKRLNPGPQFDAGAYLDMNSDVFEAGMNPLWHYIAHGQFEDRQTKPVSQKIAMLESASVDKAKTIKAVVWEPDSIDEASAMALLAATPLFDASWYSVQYGDVARAGIAPALHYLRYGAGENRKPSLYFDPVFYRSQTRDLSGNDGNPLLHYLIVGKEAGLKPIALLNFTPPGRKLVDGRGVNDPLVPSPESFRASQPEWSLHDRLALAQSDVGLFWHETLLGKLDGQNPSSVDFTPLTAFYRLFNQGGNSPLRVGQALNKSQATELSPFRAASFRGLGPVLRQGASPLADLWFATQNTLRMRFSGAGTKDGGPHKNGPLVIRAFQADLAVPDRLILAGQGLIADAGPSIVDLVLDNPLAPIILTVSTLDEMLVEFGLLPFPSLCRGGHHNAELAGAFERGNPMDDFRAFSDGLVREFCGWGELKPAPFAIFEILVRLDGATGSEKIFSPAVREWLLAIFGVRLRTSAAETEGTKYIENALANGEGIRTAISSRISERKHGATLVLCGEGLPTLSALASRRIVRPAGSTGVVGSYLIAEKAASRPLWQVAVPPLHNDLLDIQPAEAPMEAPLLTWADAAGVDSASENAEANALPLAIVYRQQAKASEAALMAPRAPDAAGRILRADADATLRTNWSVTAVVTGFDSTSARNAIATLAQQTIAPVIDVILVTEDGTFNHMEDLQRLFPGRHRILAETGDLKRDLEAAAAHSDAQFMLVLDSFTVMHDIRTLETLCTMISVERVASAGCAILRETIARKGSIVRFQSGGFFPSHVSFISAPQLIVTEPNILDALPESTYAVFANNFNCALVRTDLIRSACALEDGVYSGGRFELRFALAALADGYRHVCTTGVRVTSTAPVIAREDIDPLGSRFIRPSRWEQLLSSVTLVRELR